VGVLLTPIIVKQTLSLDDLRGARLAVDAHGELYQFLALIRLRDGTPLRDSKGRITPHLAGLFYRTTRLIADYGLQLVFVFDGVPPPLKMAELDARRAVRERYEQEHAAALAAGDLPAAYSKATMTSRLTRRRSARAPAAARHPDRPGAVRSRSAGGAHGRVRALSGRPRRRTTIRSSSARRASSDF
jgi:flap endonuclease-1